MVESETDGTADATRRLNVKKQTLDDAYAVPANFLEIDVLNPKTTELPGKKRYTEYEVHMRVSNNSISDSVPWLVVIDYSRRASAKCVTTTWIPCLIPIADEPARVQGERVPRDAKVQRL